MIERAILVLFALSAPFVVATAAESLPATQADIAFIDQATMATLAEIGSAEIAIKRKLSADDLAFANDVVRQGVRRNAQLAELARHRGVTLPETMSAVMGQKVAELGEVNDSLFQKAFLAFQISGCTQSIDLFEREGTAGVIEELKAFAQVELTSLKEHLVTARHLDGR
jgi:putative membrane protein